MCSVCSAENAISSTLKDGFHAFLWSGQPQSIDVWASGSPENYPSSVKVRLTGESEWSMEIYTDDLAGFLGLIGVDIKYIYTNKLTKDWVSKNISTAEFINNIILRFLHK